MHGLLLTANINWVWKKAIRQSLTFSLSGYNSKYD